MLITGFLLLAANIYYAIYNLLKLGKWYGLGAGKHQRRLARTTTGVLGGLVALQSIGELSSHDVLLALPLVFLAYLYMSYGKSVKQPADS